MKKIAAIALCLFVGLVIAKTVGLFSYTPLVNTTTNIGVSKTVKDTLVSTFSAAAYKFTTGVIIRKITNLGATDTVTLVLQHSYDGVTYLDVPLDTIKVLIGATDTVLRGDTLIGKYWNKYPIHKLHTIRNANGTNDTIKAATLGVLFR